MGFQSGTLWTSCNLGAANPWDYGDYYVWGEVSAKESYSDDDCVYCTRSANQLKSVGILADLTLAPAYDAAATVLGGGAHMPTLPQMGELRADCETEWVADYNGTGVAGLLFTSKINGRTLFFPAAGKKYGTSTYDAGVHGLYLSSQYAKYNAQIKHGYVNYIFFSPDRFQLSYFTGFTGGSGLSVRPVRF